MSLNARRGAEGAALGPFGRPWRPCLHGDGRRRQRLLRLPGRFPARRFAIGREPGAFRRRWDAIGRGVRGGADRGGTERRRTPSGGCAGAWVRRGGGNRPAGGKGASTVRLLYGGWLVAPSPGLASEVAPAGEGGWGDERGDKTGLLPSEPAGVLSQSCRVIITYFSRGRI